MILQKLRQEEGKPPLDKRTFTRFPQMDFKKARALSYVGDAVWGVDQLRVCEPRGFADGQVGFRFSDAAKLQNR